MNLCPHCLAQNTIAPANGPTCSHRTAGSWWPDWWPASNEERRCAWLIQKNTTKK